MAEVSDLQKAWARAVARAWRDEAFKKRLLAEPAAAAREVGLEIPAGLELRVVENSDRVVHLILPTPLSDELSAEELGAVAGGVSIHGWHKCRYYG